MEEKAQNPFGESFKGIAPRLGRFVTHPLVLAVISVGASFFFYHQGKAAVVADAIEEGRIAGNALGQRDALAAFEQNLPTLIEKRYPGAIKRASSLGRAEGDRDGFARGKEAGRSAGIQQGREAAIAETTLQYYAEKNWQVYAKRVRRLAEWADRLESARGNRQLEAGLLSEAHAIVEAAKVLKDKYTDQADAFNTTIGHMSKALDAINYPLLRAHARSLRSNLELKEQLFLQANESIVTTFESLKDPSG